MNATTPKMRLAITMRRVRDPRHGEIRDALSADWSDYIRHVMPEATLLPATNAPGSVEMWAGDLDPGGLLLTNGNDWGEDADRDAMETELVAWFRARNRPIFGVCRGLQALNAILGGTVDQSLRGTAGANHVGTCHEINITSQKYQQLAGTNALVVNSFHNQGVTLSGIAYGLRPIAVANESVVEAFEHESEPIFAIQWHPERPGGPDEFNRLLLQEFFDGR